MKIEKIDDGAEANSIGDIADGTADDQTDRDGERGKDSAREPGAPA